MKLEDQVVNLELSKRLKELGVPQESLCYWWLLHEKDYYPNWSPFNCYDEKICSAFTVAELGEGMPSHFYSFRWMAGWMCATMDNGEVIHLPDQESGKLVTTSKTEADARAKMLIYLLENKLMDAPK